jgi:hypothetical protein
LRGSVAILDRNVLALDIAGFLRHRRALISLLPYLRTVRGGRTERRIGGKSVMRAKHPEVRVRLTGATDDFCILDIVTKALRKAGVPSDEIERFCDQALAATERDLLQICGQWVTLAS